MTHDGTLIISCFSVTILLKKKSTGRLPFFKKANNEILYKVYTVFYALVSVALILIAVTMIFYSFYEVYLAFKQGIQITETMLNVIGILVVSIAVFDVAVYLIDESVLAQSE
ncbi:MAG: hypothetical protein NPINA01_23160 [Nitrospinaceae bacterium]|nr:MAG: hypothetical protein NPINA01_23160 [Nitrospinaceae bacterium]